MIEEIRISSLGVIDESVLELGGGLTVITGETGAGKTMLVTALGLLLGGRADSGAVRTGARAARVEGVVRADGDLEAIADEHGGEVEDGQLLLARQVSAEGRSRAFLGGASVPASALSRVGDSLVAVHGQSDQHRLLRPEAQRDALDSHAGPALQSVLARYGAGFTRLRAVEAELREVLGSARERAREADVLRLGLEEIEAVDPQPGEEDSLATEENRLGFADTLRTAAETAREALSSDTDSPDALGAVAAARRVLESVREHDPEVASLADRVAEVSYLLADVAADVAAYSTGVETDPGRLAHVSERRAALTALTRKYGETSEQVLEWAREASQRLLGLDGSDERIAQLRGEREQLRTELAATAEELTRLRTAAAKDLSAVVTDELHSLSMPHARFGVHLDRVEDDSGLQIDKKRWRFSATGVDEVELLLAANTGAEPRALTKGASGGELSRVMLAIEVALADTRPVPDLRLRRGGCRGRRQGGGRDRAEAGCSGQVGAGARGHAPAAGRRVRGPARRRTQGQRRHGHHLGPRDARRRRPGAGAVPDAGRARGVRHRDGARRGAPRHGAGVQDGRTPDTRSLKSRPSAQPVTIRW